MKSETSEHQNGSETKKDSLNRRDDEKAVQDDRQNEGLSESDNTKTDPNCIEASVPEDFESIKQRAEQYEDTWEKYVRLNADFENFKKRAARDRLEAIKYANEALIEKLLPVMDNFEAALQAAEKASSGAAESLLTGVKMIASQLKNIFMESGLEEIDADGKPFDPSLHEALSQTESSEVPEGTVLHQVRKGYKLKDRLVRPASVVVATVPKGSKEDAR